MVTIILPSILPRLRALLTVIRCRVEIFAKAIGVIGAKLISHGDNYATINCAVSGTYLVKESRNPASWL